MKSAALLLGVFLTLAVGAARAGDVAEAKRILDRYLAAPVPKGPSKTDAYDARADKEVSGAQQARLAILAELKTMPNEAVLAAEPVLSKQARPQQRREIVGALGDNIQTRECAELLHRVLEDARRPKDADEAACEEVVRSSAVLGLRTMARRTDRPGGKRIPLGPDFEPKVPGLVPYLVSAANDPAEQVRTFALYALADTRDPTALAELRNRLQDKSATVRFYAACFLTEYQDASGLPEMRKALNRLRSPESVQDMTRNMQTEILLASFERITGKSLGEIPRDPSLSSSLEHARDAAKRYGELLDDWQAWWDK